MTIHSLPKSIHPLVDYLDNLTERAGVDELKQHLATSNVTMDDLAPWVVFDEGGYRRNLICEGKHYHMLALCWKSGQRSPIHNHASSTCGLKVLTGTATETIFAHTPCGQVVAVGSSELTAGEVAASQDSDTHQISNVQVEGDNLVTLHIYSPPLHEMDMYSITGDEMGMFRPTVFEHADGSGI